jgi:hypothetical protein
VWEVFWQVQEKSTCLDRTRLVVTYCVHTLTWMQDVIQGSESSIQDLVVYSTYSLPVVSVPRLSYKSNENSPISETEIIVQLSNVGRCDHGHA